MEENLNDCKLDICKKCNKFYKNLIYFKNLSRKKCVRIFWCFNYVL